MSLYNMLFGENPMSAVLLKALGLTKEQCGRYRDITLSGDKIILYTRNGGGNRGCWNNNEDDCECPGCIMGKELPNHPNYITDYDDDYDSTYAYVEFSIPEQYRELFEELKKENQDVRTVSEKFNELIEKLK